MDITNAEVTNTELDEVELRVMMLADGAQAVGGKLYILGGGFDRINMPAIPFTHSFALAILIEVPWNATNQPCQIVVELLNADNEPAGYRADATLETGRPPGMRQGTSLMVPVAIPVIAEFGEPGRYVLRGSINGKEKNRVALEAISQATAIAA